MLTNTYVALATQTLGSAAASVTFSSISSAYTDLVLVAQPLKTTAGGGTLRYQVNSDSGTNYSNTTLYGDGSTAGSDRASSAVYGRIGFWTGDNQGNTFIANFQNYSNTTTYKTVLSRTNNLGSLMGATVNLWRSTSAITSIYIYNDGGNFAAGSTFSLYGIKTANAGLAKATGGTITFDGSGNVIHTFTSSGTFTPLQSLTCDYLVIAGGGGGGSESGGGGGAGGYRTTVGTSGGGAAAESALACASGVGLTVTVGAGGAGSPNTSTNGGLGANSVFSSITSTGGGGGKTRNGGSTGTSGGSGGGGGYTNITGASGTANQGYSGGDAISANNSNGGGGGAGAIGASALGTTPGAGGVGVSSSITGLAVFRGGGGGGGAGNAAGAAGGNGGGGAGSGPYDSPPGGNATANTGGGGGGQGNALTPLGGNGGSGIVIIRYAG